MVSRFPIRRFRLSDMDRILNIEHASFGRDSYDRNLFAEFFHNCGDLFLVVERAGNVCGYMVTCKRGERAELVSVAVDPRFRAKGIATALMESTIRRLRRRGVRRFSLTVRVTNRAAIGLYVKHGFCRERLVRGYYGKADGYRMVAVLH